MGPSEKIVEMEATIKKMKQSRFFVCGNGCAEIP